MDYVLMGKEAVKWEKYVENIFSVEYSGNKRWLKEEFIRGLQKIEEYWNNES